MGAGCQRTDRAEEAAIAACEIVPGLVADGVGQALGRGVLAPAELAIWDSSGLSSPGLVAIGPAGLGVIRANSTCSVTGVEVQDGSALVISLTREEPDLDRQEVFDRETVQDLPKRTRTLALRWADTEVGPRVHLELARAHQALERARVAAAAGDRGTADDTLRDLEAWFPDPLLRWERARWEQQAQP